MRRPGVLDALLTAVTFYSRLPVPAPRHRPELAAAVWTVPVAGVVVALPAALALVVFALLGASPLVAATVSAIVLLAVTGALHEDGLADCADGFWGGASRTRRLEIMRDSRIGTYGVLALVVAVLLKVALVAQALSDGALSAALMVLAAAAAARTVALYPWVGLPNAREDGLAVTMGRPSPAVFRRAALLSVAVTAALLLWWAPLAFVIAAIAAAAAAKAVASLADAKIGGHTGDVIGAAVVVSELAYLAAFTMWRT